MAEHYYTENPTSEIKERTFTQVLNNRELTLTSVSGVFSFDNRVDKASDLLIRTFSPTGRSVLDLGCGYGAIGLYIKAIYPKQVVCMTDINERAVEYTMLNASKNHLSVKAIKSDLYSALDEIVFDDIVTNPPLAAGKKLLTRLIDDAYDHLRTNGCLWLVAFHNKGGATLKEIMKARFNNVEDMEKCGGIRVYRSVRL